MSILSSFTPFNFNEGVPYASITINGISFNKSVMLKLNCPEYVVLLIDYATKRIAIQCCASTYPNAVPFYKKEKGNATWIRWNGKDLLNTLQVMMGWDLNNASYKVDGVFLKEENAVLFDLNKATETEPAKWSK